MKKFIILALTLFLVSVWFYCPTPSQKQEVDRITKMLGVVAENSIPPTQSAWQIMAITSKIMTELIDRKCKCQDKLGKGGNK